MLCKECLGKIYEIRYNTIIRISPKASKFKAVAGFLFLGFSGFCILYSIMTGTVRVILRIRPVADNKDLDKLKQAAPCPERISLIPVDLIKRLPDWHSTTFQLNMYERQTIHQDSNIIPVIMFCALVCADNILVYYLQAVIMNIGFINDCDILGTAIIPLQNLNIIFLDLSGLFLDMLVRISDRIRKKPAPFIVTELVIV